MFVLCSAVDIYSHITLYRYFSVSSNLYFQTGEFNWDSSTQSLLIGAMFYGYVITQLPGGVLAEKLGARLVFGLTGLLSGIITMATPFIAHWNVKVLVASRVLIGLIQVGF